VRDVAPFGRAAIIARDVGEYGEWNREGATLSEVTARKEYGVDPDFIIKGIKAQKLEYREGAMHYARQPVHPRPQAPT
jgi:hypothetical protein